ncbi:MAG TPA: hypothetical protein VFE47_27025 [Tepidisphaeraceae bacterium]|jgi:competence protein ComGC|nr:hypothetical protein [Tepidisphaeraceae bacterium]
MTQSNPSEIICPHCGQTYAIQPGQWPQYQGRSIPCTKCGQTFAVGSAPGSGPAAAPPALPAAMPPGYGAQPYPAPGYPPQGYGFPPPRKGMSGGAVAAIVIGVLVVIAIPCLISILLPALNKVREEALKAKCAANMRMIASAMITYSGSNGGQYPDSMSTLIRTSGLSPMTYVCPASNDTPFTKSASSITEADLPGHCSYLYTGRGYTTLTLNPNDILLYEAGTDHNSKGMNVLYGDYHVSWINKALMPSTLQAIQAQTPPMTAAPPPPPTIPQ